jgi:hypothetical protein
MELNSQIHALIAFSQRKEVTVPIERQAGWVPGPVWRFLDKRNLLPLQGTKLQKFRSVA